MPRLTVMVDGPTSDEAADPAWQEAVAAERKRWMRWIGTALRRSSADLLPRLPLADAVKLACLVGSGRSSWAEINAALDARIKLATAVALAAARDQLDRRPPSWRQSDRAWAAYQDWQEAKREGECEIWAQYDARCDTLFAGDADPIETDASALDQMLSRERIMDRFRSERDRQLAALTERLGPAPTPPTTPPVRLKPYDLAMLRSQLTADERAALDKLNATGFAASPDMTGTIDALAAEIVANIASVA